MSLVWVQMTWDPAMIGHQRSVDPWVNCQLNFLLSHRLLLISPLEAICSSLMRLLKCATPVFQGHNKPARLKRIKEEEGNYNQAEQDAMGPSWDRPYSISSALASLGSI